VNKYISVILLSLTFITSSLSAQDKSYVQRGEVGVTGTTHYFGDLNNTGLM
jgi:hypothetical protein